MRRFALPLLLAAILAVPFFLFGSFHGRSSAPMLRDLCAPISQVATACSQVPQPDPALERILTRDGLAEGAFLPASPSTLSADATRAAAVGPGLVGDALRDPVPVGAGVQPAIYTGPVLLAADAPATPAPPPDVGKDLGAAVPWLIHAVSTKAAWWLVAGFVLMLLVQVLKGKAGFNVPLVSPWLDKLNPLYTQIAIALFTVAAFSLMGVSMGAAGIGAGALAGLKVAVAGFAFHAVHKAATSTQTTTTPATTTTPPATA